MNFCTSTDAMDLVKHLFQCIMRVTPLTEIGHLWYGDFRCKGAAFRLAHALPAPSGQSSVRYTVVTHANNGRCFFVHCRIGITRAGAIDDHQSRQGESYWQHSPSVAFNTGTIFNIGTAPTLDQRADTNHASTVPATEDQSPIFGS